MLYYKVIAKKGKLRAGDIIKVVETNDLIENDRVLIKNKHGKYDIRKYKINIKDEIIGKIISLQRDI